MTLIKHVALCGNPKAGKDEVAKIMGRAMNYATVDDGLILRQAAPMIFGYNAAYNFSQEGKARMVQTPDRPRSVRDVLGSLGNALEKEFGEMIMPWAAVQLAEKMQSTETDTTRFVYTSCRKNQGQYYRRRGGIVIEVSRPEARPSGFDFDKWNPENVDHVLRNDGTLDQLTLGVMELFKQISDTPERRADISCAQL